MSILWNRFFRDSPLLLSAVDQTLTCRHLSAAWRERLELPPTERVDRPVTEIFALETDPEVQIQLQRLFENGTAIEKAQAWLATTKGPVPGCFAAWRVQPAKDQPDWAILAFTETCTDEETRDELARLRSTHQLILDAAGEGIYGLDNQGNATFVNQAAEQILGWRSQDVLGQSAHDVHHHSYPDGSPYPRLKCPIYSAFKDGEVHRVDHEVFWHTNGSAVPVEYTSTPIRRDGNLDGAVVVFRDISERKQIERQREEAYEQIKCLKEQLEQERDYLRDEINVTVNFGEMIGESQALKRTVAQIDAVAQTSASVLILGESGVGKEMIAHAIHARSNRADKPLVKVNCASIPKDLFESEFFGHVRGAFTGAHRDRVGRLQLATDGTLFLDEIGEIPLSQQGKLLRALQEHEFERVGDDKTIKVDVRIVAATNRNLEEEVEAGRFREDLYYRLSVFPIEVPPLRDRVDDIVPVALHFLEQVSRDLGRRPPRLTQQQAALLRNHHWPGNIRELKNVMERAAILSKGDRLRLDLAMSAETLFTPATDTAPHDKLEFVRDAELRQREKANMIAALHCSNWRISGADGAAELLGLKPSTLTYRMGVFGIQKP